MRVRRHDDEWGMRAEILPFEDSTRGSVEVYRRRSLNHLGKWEASTQVNWSALGSTDAVVARLYAEAILKACCIAEEMALVRDDELTTPNGYMVAYQHEETGRTVWRRIENGEDVPMLDGWRVSKAQYQARA